MVDDAVNGIQAEENPACASSGVQDADMPEGQIRHNMVICTALNSLWAIGWAFQVALTPLLARHLHATNAQIGLISTAQIAALVGSFTSPWITRRFRIKKWYLFCANLPYHLALGVIGIMVIMQKQLHLGDHQLLLWVLGLMGVHNLFAGFVNLPHLEYKAACIPSTHRGRFNGYSGTVSALVGFGATFVAGYVLKTVPPPFRYGYCFLLTFLICQSGYTVALLAKEKPTPVEKSPAAWSREMLKTAWEDRPYIRYLVSQVLGVVVYGSMIGFMLVYGLKSLNMPDSASATVGLITQAGSFFVSSPAGIIVDRVGGRRVIQYAPLLTVACAALLFVFHSPIAVFAATALVALFNPIFINAGSVLYYGLPKPEHRAGHYTTQSQSLSLVP